jgi:uncharacterized protein (TIGR02145 family)
MNVDATYENQFYGAGSALPSSYPGICPDGWHIPVESEWTTLENLTEPNVSSGGTGGGVLRAQAGWSFKGINQSGTDSDGLRFLAVFSNGNGSSTAYWTPTQDESDFTSASAEQMIFNSGFNATGFPKMSQYPVRCIQGP